MKSDFKLMKVCSSIIPTDVTKILVVADMNFVQKPLFSKLNEPSVAIGFYYWSKFFH